MPRHSYQSGTLIQVPAKSGAYWRFRWRENGVHRSEFVGTVAAFPTRAQAEKAADQFRQSINAGLEVITISELIAKFWKEAAPERETTAHSYRSIFKRVERDWGTLRLDEFARNILPIENWLKELTVIGRHPKPGKPRQVSSLYRGQVKNLLHFLVEKAMIWNHLQMQKNPMDLIRLKDASKRKKELTILTLEQYQALLADPELPLLVKTLMQVCTGLGLRISEALGLRWDDLNFELGEVQIQRAASSGQVGDTKTSSSAAKLPLHPEIIAVLQMWRMTEPVVKGWVFGSERTSMPYNRDYLRSEYLIPAGERIGLPGLGWHSLRHGYRALLREAGVEPETQKNLLRHARLSTTMDTYGGKSSVEELRPANAAVIDILTRKTA